MALETLKDVKEIGGHPVHHGDLGHNCDTYGEMDDLLHDITIDERLNAITFRLQNGPIKEVGVNGCQVDTLIHAAKLIIEGFNEKFPCPENEQAIIRLDQALFWLAYRKRNREARGVEGTSKE